MAGLSQYGLNNPWTIESNVHIIIVTGLWIEGCADWKIFGDWGPRAGYEGRGPNNSNIHLIKKIKIEWETIHIHIVKCIDNVFWEHFNNISSIFHLSHSSNRNIKSAIYACESNISVSDLFIGFLFLTCGQRS